MMMLQIQILIIAIYTAVAASLPGIFLVLRGVSLMSDAISHSVLLGIALMFLITGSLNTMPLIIGAIVAGIVTVIATEGIIATDCVRKETAIGLVFPLFFSLGVAIISAYARDVHLDTDMVLIGDIAFAPFTLLWWGGYLLGPRALWIMMILASLNALLLWVAYKELLVTTFDEQFSRVIGYRPRLFYYLLMVVTSITAVCAFDLVGSIVVVALMIIPSATARLLTSSVTTMLYLVPCISASAAIIGCCGAVYGDVSITGSIAVAAGFLFIIALYFTPKKTIQRLSQSSPQQEVVAVQVLCSVLAHYKVPCSLSLIMHRLGWSAPMSAHIIEVAHRAGRVVKEQRGLELYISLRTP